MCWHFEAEGTGAWGAAAVVAIGGGSGQKELLQNDGVRAKGLTPSAIDHVCPSCQEFVVGGGGAKSGSGGCV